MNNETEDEKQRNQTARLREALPQVRKTLLSLIESPDVSAMSPAQLTARGLIDRACCWVATMHRLDETTYFQAHMAGLRALLELTIDLALLSMDRSNNEKIEAWERSALFKQANQLVMYGKNHKTTMPLEPPHEFIVANRTAVEADRKRFWGGTHPSRWTNRNLQIDAREVQGRYPRLHVERLYEEYFRQACWLVHGSALLTMRGATGKQMIPVVGIAMLTTSDLALACAELALRIFDTFGFDKQQWLSEERSAFILTYGGIDVAGVTAAEWNDD